jgi:hypothetical protein
VILRVDDVGLKTALEHVAAPLVAGVETLGVEPVQSVHPLRHGFAPGFQDEVIVRGHEAVGVTDPEKRKGVSGQLLDEVVAIHVIAEESITTDRPGGDVKEAIVQLASWPSRHRPNQ